MAQKAPSFEGGDEWAFLSWGLGTGEEVGSSQGIYASIARLIISAIGTCSRLSGLFQRFLLSLGERDGDPFLGHLSYLFLTSTDRVIESSISERIKE
jgi:hypothetical protein